MSPEKILQKIQTQIKELVPRLEVFVEPTIQPTSEECDDLKNQLNNLQDNLAVYRYLRQNKELSPSFNIHAKISEMQAPTPAEKPLPLVESEPKRLETPPVKTELKEVIADSISQERQSAHKPIAVGINDKFRFINELFAQNAPEYNIAIEQLNTLSTWHDAEIYLSSLKNLYEWKENSDITKVFYTVVKKRFT